MIWVGRTIKKWSGGVGRKVCMGGPGGGGGELGEEGSYINVVQKRKDKRACAVPCFKKNELVAKIQATIKSE